MIDQHAGNGAGARRRRGTSAIRPVLAASLAAGAAVAGSFGAAGTAAATSTKPPATASAAFPHAVGKLQTMIVFLRGGGGSLKAREASARTIQAPVVRELKASGAHVVATTSFIDTVIANMSAAQAKALRSDPAVSRVIPSTSVPLPAMSAARDALPTLGTRGTRGATTTAPCGSAAKPEQDPEALGNINFAGAQAAHIDGAGVNVGFMAGGIDPANADLLRNAAYASGGSPKGSKVITKYVDFGGDGTAAPSGDAGSEAWGDASSIAAQGNVSYDLSKFVNTAHPLPSGCDIRITGDAPGANLFALEIFATANSTTTSGFLQAINYAVTNGVKVLSQSFGGNPFPDLSLDVIRKADEQAVADGVTVVASSGDAGITSTEGSPATDPAVIGVGATTTFRAYAQETFGGINAPAWKGGWTDNNISSISSAGFSQRGGTVDLVAPGDLGWALCSTKVVGKSPMFPLCTNENGALSPIQDFGGTSQACPFVSGAAADVIQAYRDTHKGQWPAPALVKQILTSSATDIDAPANEQGAGLLNIGAAVKLAESIAPTTAKSPAGGILSSPNQVDFEGTPGSAQSQAIRITNTGTKAETVSLSTRAVASKPSSTTGLKTFCMNPAGSNTCPKNTGTFKIWSGVTEVYQTETFTVAAGAARLALSADYQFTGQSSLLHFGLFSPSGAFSAYSLPQGLGDYGEVEVANPEKGTWTAVFFTVQNGSAGTGTSGPIQWEATTWKYVTGGTVTPATLSLGAGKSGVATVKLTAPTAAGDTAQSVVIKSASGTNTIPVVMRTLVGISTGGGKFSGVLTGGNGRGGGPAQSNTFAFVVPANKPSLDVNVKLATTPSAILLGDQLTAYLVDPNGSTVSYSSNLTTDGKGKPEAVNFVSLYHSKPMAGEWRVLLQWPNPVAGNALSAPFSGTISFTKLKLASNNVPNSATATIKQNTATPFTVNVCNPSSAPQAFFVDPRLPASTEYPLANVFGAALPQVLGSISLPNAETGYIVPPDTTEIQANIAGTLPVTFDTSYLPGDPDLSPAVAEPGVSGSQSGDTAALTYSNPEISPGLWGLVPDEIGPYGTTGYKAGQAQVNFSVFTQEFDPTVTSSTGDMWQNVALDTGPSNGTPLYLTPAGSGSTNCGNITVTIKPTAAVNSIVSGTLYLDDLAIASTFAPTVPVQSQIFPMADQALAIPYKYKVS